MKYLLLITLFAALIPLGAKAQDTPIQEFGISPFLEELDVAKGSTVSSSVKVTNRSSEAIEISISTRDFLPGDRGEALFVPDDEINETTFSLAAWIQIKQGSSVTIPAGETVTIDYTVNPPSNAEEGTHYGAILFSNTSESGLPGVGIDQAIGTIILVGYGQAQPQGELDFSTDPTVVWWNNNFNFTNLFRNTGNVHVKPKGEVEIKNIFGKVVASPAINRDANNVLPKSERTFISTWYPEPWRFGRYKAESVVFYGREKLEVRATQTIWILPAYTLSAIGFVLVIVLWFALHGRHWHRKRVVSRHLETQNKN